MFHDSNAFVLEDALDCMAGIKDVFIYDIVPMGMYVPMSSTMYHPYGIINPRTTGGILKATNTTFRNDIATATTGNATFVFNQLMNYSPWLSMDALATLAAKEGVFTDLQIRNVLKANPQAGRSGWIKSILLNRSTPMSPFYIAAIVANADSLTDRDTLAWQVAEANTNYDLLLNDLVGWYLDDTLNHIATLDTLLTHPSNPMYRYQLAGMYFEQGLYSDYQNVLDSIPAQIDLTDQEADYHTTYNNLYNQIKAWKLDSMPLPLLDSSQLVWLQNFYEANPKMPGIGHALLAINDTSYNITDPVYITDTTVYSGPEPFMLDIKETERTKKLVNVYPNPTSKGITLEVKNYSITENYKIILSDLNGKEILKKEWPKGEKSVKIDMSNLPPGIYYCKISSQGKTIETHKVLLTK